MHTNTGVHIRTHNSLLNSIGHKTATPLCLKLPSIAASFTFTPLSHPAHTCSHPVMHTQVCPTVLRECSETRSSCSPWKERRVVVINACYHKSFFVFLSKSLSAFLDFHCLTVPIKILVCFPDFRVFHCLTVPVKNLVCLPAFPDLHCLTVPVKILVCFPACLVFHCLTVPIKILVCSPDFLV